MQLFVSTTFASPEPSELEDVLGLIKHLGFDGVELGSTHKWQPDLVDVVKRQGSTRWLSHNFFPPAPESDFVINIASTESGKRRESLDHVKKCIEFASSINAELYTVHPGFLAQSIRPNNDGKGANGYDFNFSGNIAKREKAYDMLVDSLSSLISFARGCDVRLAIETEGSLTNPQSLLIQTPEDFAQLFDAIPNDLWINFNLAHTSLAATLYGFSVRDFISKFASRMAAAEISHYEGKRDEHLPLNDRSWVIKWLDHLPDVPLILEFRNATVNDLMSSRDIMRRHSMDGKIKN